MNRADRVQLGVGLVGLGACVALNVWVFRFGILAGLVGLNLTKHVGVAVLCQAVGVNRGQAALTPPRRRWIRRHRPQSPLAGPHALARDAR